MPRPTGRPRHRILFPETDLAAASRRGRMKFAATTAQSPPSRTPARTPARLAGPRAAGGPPSLPPKPRGGGWARVRREGNPPQRLAGDSAARAGPVVVDRAGDAGDGAL